MFISKDIQLEKTLEVMKEQYVYEMWEGDQNECPPTCDHCKRIKRRMMPREGG